MKNYQKVLFSIGILFFVTCIGFFGRQNKQVSPAAIKQSDIKVYASFYPMYYFAGVIGGEKAIVFNLTPAGTQPHDFDPTPRDIAQIETSDMLVLNGGNLESWGEKVKNILAGKNVLVITAGEGIIGRGGDPHIWLDPVSAKHEAENIEKGFEQADPKNISYYQKNLEELNREFEKLDMEYKNGLKNCMIRDFITSHTAFGYLAARYNINQVAISGILPDEEPSPQKMAEISDLVKKEDIKIIFFENLVSPRLSETIANESGAKTETLDPIEGLSSVMIKNEENYFTVMKKNLTKLEEALQCKI